MYSAFILHKSQGGNATEPFIGLQCFGPSGCLSFCTHNCHIEVGPAASEPGSREKSGLDFPNPNCRWQETSGPFSKRVQCYEGCGVPLQSLGTLYPAEKFDNAMEMVFGDKTSVGYLCGVKEAVTDPARNATIPGYCCLDSPTDSLPWGKSVSVWLRRRFLIAELNSSRTHDCAISSFYFLDVHTIVHVHRRRRRDSQCL